MPATCMRQDGSPKPMKLFAVTAGPKTKAVKSLWHATMHRVG